MQNRTTTAAFNSAEPDADQFRAGDRWQSPRGTIYKVVRIEYKRSGSIAHMVNEKTQRTAHRAYDDLGSFESNAKPWVRLHSGSN